MDGHNKTICMVFNASKFELMRYVPRTEEVWNYQYVAPDGSPIEQKQQLRDLGVIMSDTAKFEDQIKAVVVKSKQQMGWILRSFSTREAYPMLTLFRAMVLPLIEYCCQIWSPRTVGNIRLLESVQRTFTNRISGMQHLDYWERLKKLNLYSLERRRERYQIIYIWKMINELVPNIDTDDEIRIILSGRRGRICRIPPINNRAAARVQSDTERKFVCDTRP